MNGSNSLDLQSLKDNLHCILKKNNTRVALSTNGIFRAPLPRMTPGMKANADFFSHPVWGPRYFEVENHPGLIAERWRAAIGGDWNGKVVVDLGCGPVLTQRFLHRSGC